MTAVRPERVVTITDDTTRAEIAETIQLVCDNAKRIRRRGYVGTASEAYALQHRRIDALLDDWRDAQA